MGHTNPRTTIRDAVLDGVTEDLDADAVHGVEDATVTATETACLNSGPLLDFDEYWEVSL